MKKYSDLQLFYYNRAMHGLKVYTHEEIEEMLFQKKKRIIKVYRRSQDIINEYKQFKLTQKTNKVFEMFKNSKLCQDIVNSSETDKEFLSTLSFKDLDITRDEIIETLYKHGALPLNFYEL